MRRLLHHILLALSLLLCAAVAGMWVRSYWYADYVYYTVPEEGRSFGTVRKEAVSYGVLQRRGVLQLEWLTNMSVAEHSLIMTEFDTEDEWRGNSAGCWAWGAVDLTDGSGAELLRFHVSKVRRGGVGWREPESSILQFGYARILYPDGAIFAGPTPGVCRLVTIPHWAIGLPGLILPCLTLSSAWRRRRRRVRGLCEDCGYDLRATPARCPECGREAASPATAR